MKRWAYKEEFVHFDHFGLFLDKKIFIILLKMLPFAFILRSFSLEHPSTCFLAASFALRTLLRATCFSPSDLLPVAHLNPFASFSIRTQLGQSVRLARVQISFPKALLLPVSSLLCYYFFLLHFFSWGFLSRLRNIF